MNTTNRVEHFITEKRSELIEERTRESLLPGTLPFVTIASQSGAGGNQLAKSLIELIHADDHGSDALRNWRIFDKSMCQQVLEEEHLATSMRELLAEDYHSQIEEFIRGIYGDRGMQNVAYVRLSRLLRAVAAVGKVIILGHGGFMATKDLAGGIHVRLIAPLPMRAARMASTLGVEEEEAMQQIRRRDVKRKKLLKTHYHIDSGDPGHYDLVCNTERLLPHTMAEMLMPLLHRRIGIHNSSTVAT